MLNRLNHVWGKALACIGGCAAIAIMASPPLVQMPPSALFGAPRPTWLGSPKSPPVSISRSSGSTITAVPVRRQLKVGLGKSVLLEFSRELRDVMVSNPRKRSTSSC